MADRIADPTGLAAKVVGVRDLWARFERAGTADRRRDGTTVLRRYSAAALQCCGYCSRG